MAARQLSAKKPKRLGYTLGRLMRYLAVTAFSCWR